MNGNPPPQHGMGLRHWPVMSTTTKRLSVECGVGNHLQLHAHCFLVGVYEFIAYLDGEHQ